MIGPSVCEELGWGVDNHISDNRPAIILVPCDNGEVYILDGCPKYEDCLYEAAKKDWPSFTCANCDLFKENK